MFASGSKTHCKLRFELSILFKIMYCVNYVIVRSIKQLTEYTFYILKGLFTIRVSFNSILLTKFSASTPTLHITSHSSLDEIIYNTFILSSKSQCLRKYTVRLCDIRQI